MKSSTISEKRHQNSKHNDAYKHIDQPKGWKKPLPTKAAKLSNEKVSLPNSSKPAPEVLGPTAALALGGIAATAVTSALLFSYQGAKTKLSRLERGREQALEALNNARLSAGTLAPRLQRP